MKQFQFDHTTMEAVSRTNDYKCTKLHSSNYDAYQSLHCITFTFNKHTGQLVYDYVHLVNDENYTEDMECVRMTNHVSTDNHHVLLESAKILQALYKVNEYNFDSTMIELGNTIQNTLRTSQNMLTRGLDMFQQTQGTKRRSNTLTANMAIKRLLYFIRKKFHLLQEFKPLNMIQSRMHILSSARKPENVNGIRILLLQNSKHIVCVRVEKLHIQFPEQYITYAVEGPYNNASICQTWRISYTPYYDQYAYASIVSQYRNSYLSSILYGFLKTFTLFTLLRIMYEIR